MTERPPGPSWEDFGVDETGLPVHLPVGLNAAGQGPVADREAVRWECWCGLPGCCLNAFLVRVMGPPPT